MIVVWKVLDIDHPFVIMEYSNRRDISKSIIYQMFLKCYQNWIKLTNMFILTYIFFYYNGMNMQRKKYFFSSHGFNLYLLNYFFRLFLLNENLHPFFPLRMHLISTSFNYLKLNEYVWLHFCCVKSIRTTIPYLTSW